MANIVLRDGLGRLLTKAEGDANFTNLNDELAQAESRFYGDVDPATINGVTVGPGFEWAHETAGVLKRRNAANNGWVVVGPLFSELATKSSVDAKVDKVTGKGLSTEDYTTTEKNKLAGVEAGATANLSDSYLLDSANHVYNPANSDLPASTDKTKGAIDILSFGVERLIRPDDAPCIIKTGANTVSVKAGTRVPVLGVKFDTNTAITMPTLTAGSDYSVWVHPDGAVSAVADPFT
ncbi:MAG TPA: hypothetical protein DIU11_14785, partial [Pusillimonas sp.]|nr:hypothetical protein [Pusillimonas sp.]